MIICAWCGKDLREGVGHGVCALCAANVARGDDPGEWPLPPKEGDIDSRWLDAFICTRLQNVFARRYYGTLYTRLPVRDRVALRSTVENFIEDTTAEFEPQWVIKAKWEL